MSYTLSLAACGLPAHALEAAERHVKGALEAHFGGPQQVLDAWSAHRYSNDSEATQRWQAALQGALLGAPGAAEQPAGLHLQVQLQPASPLTAGHRSRLGCMVIDCQTEDVFGAAAFWSAALGWPVAPPQADSAQRYRELQSPDSEIQVLVQAVDHESRVHLDIETDDIDAEVARLEALGARRVKFVKRWWVMESPTGQRFCVVRPQRPDFADHANLWPSTQASPAGEK